MGDTGLWNEEEGFFFDAITLPNGGGGKQLKVGRERGEGEDSEGEGNNNNKKN